MSLMQIKREDSGDEAERNHWRHPGLKDKDQQMVQQEATEQGTQVEQSRGAEQEETKQSCDEKKMWKKNDMGAEQEATEQSSEKKYTKIAMCTYFKKICAGLERIVVISPTAEKNLANHADSDHIKKTSCAIIGGTGVNAQTLNIVNWHTESTSLEIRSHQKSRSRKKPGSL